MRCTNAMQHYFQMTTYWKLFFNIIHSVKVLCLRKTSWQFGGIRAKKRVQRILTIIVYAYHKKVPIINEWRGWSIMAPAKLCVSGTNYHF